MDGGVNIGLKSAEFRIRFLESISRSRIAFKIDSPINATPPPTIESSDKFPIYLDATWTAPGYLPTPPIATESARTLESNNFSNCNVVDKSIVVSRPRCNCLWQLYSRLQYRVSTPELLHVNLRVLFDRATILRSSSLKKRSHFLASVLTLRSHVSFLLSSIKS